MADFIVNVYGKRYKITAPDASQAGTAALKLRQEFAQQNPKAVGEFMRNVPAEQRQPLKAPEARHPLANAPASQASAYGMGAANTGGMGFADEAAAGIGSMISGDPYQDVLGEIRGLDTAAKEQHPNSYLTGQVGGGLAQAAATGGAGFLQNAGSLGGRMLGGALTGGAYGGIYGAGEGTDLASRAKGAAVNAGLGAAVGGAIPLVATGASKIFGAARDALTMPGEAARGGYSPASLRMAGDVMNADQTLGQTGRANIAAAGPDAMLVDAGPNARTVLDTAIQKVGPGATQARQAITDRTARAATDVNQALDTAFGQPEGIMTAREAIRTGSQAARSAAYDGPNGAYAQAIDYASPNGQLLEQMVKNRVPQSAINRANELMRANGEQSRQILAHVADDGTVTFERLPDVRQLDYITRALNDVADEASSKGKLGGTTALGNAYSNLSKNIRQTLRNAVPEYGQALDTAADPIQRSNAIKLGSQLLSSSMTRDEALHAMAGMSQAERNALKQGIRSHVDDMMANVARTVQDGDVPAREAIKALKDFSSRSTREKVTMAIGQKEADALFERLDRAAKTFELRAGVADNSKTYARLAAERAVKARSAPGVIGTAMEGKPINATQRLVQSITGRTPEAVARKDEAMWKEIADLLTSRPDQNPGIMNSIDRIVSGDTANQLMQGRINRLITSGTYPAVPQSRKLLPENLR